MNNLSSQTLPSLEEFKQQAKELKKSGNFEKLGHAQDALAKNYGYKGYRAIKLMLKSSDTVAKDIQPKVMSIDTFKQIIKEQVFGNNNPTVHFKQEHYFKNQKNIIDGIAINPILPEDFWNTAHEDRENVELDEWWERPFIATQEFLEESYNEYYNRMKLYYDEAVTQDGNDKAFNIESEDEYNQRIALQKASWYNYWKSGIRYDVYILDGGAWDRPTTKNKVGSLDEALEIAKRL